jgi:hypothetical protein
MDKLMGKWMQNVLKKRYNILWIMLCYKISIYTTWFSVDWLVTWLSRERLRPNVGYAKQKIHVIMKDECDYLKAKVQYWTSSRVTAYSEIMPWQIHAVLSDWLCVDVDGGHSDHILYQVFRNSSITCGFRLMGYSVECPCYFLNIM